MERPFARKQILRLGQLNGFPKDIPEAIGELIDALMNAPTEDIARDVVTSVMDVATGDTRCPFPYDIRAAVYARLDEFRPDPCCKKCKGTGWLIVERNDLSGADKCGCWARRPAPDMRQPGDEPIGEELPRQIAAAAKRLTAPEDGA